MPGSGSRSLPDSGGPRSGAFEENGARHTYLPSLPMVAERTDPSLSADLRVILALYHAVIGVVAIAAKKDLMAFALAGLRFDAVVASEPEVP